MLLHINATNSEMIYLIPLKDSKGRVIVQNCNLSGNNMTIHFWEIIFQEYQ